MKPTSLAATISTVCTECMLLLLMGGPARAQSDLPGNSIGVFFDTQGVSTSFQAVVGVPFTMYVETNRPLDGIYAFELAVQVDPRLRVLSRTADPQSDDILPGDDQWAVSFRSRCLPGTDFHVLLTYQLVADAPAPDLSICLTASSPSSVVPPAPAHVPCVTLGLPIPFIPAYVGCAQVQAAAVASSSLAWGPLKARYRSDP